MELEYDPKEGQFNFSMFGRQMLGNRIVARIGKEKALVTEINSSMGQDHYGAYQGFEMHFVSPNNEEKQFVGNIKIYEGFVIFEVCHLFEIKEKRRKRYLTTHISHFRALKVNFVTRDVLCIPLNVKCHSITPSYGRKGNGKLKGRQKQSASYH